MVARTAFAAVFLSLVLAGAPVFFTVPAVAAPAPTPYLGKYYIAVGDSYSLGYVDASEPLDPQCIGASLGFTCLFYHYLKAINPGLGFVNFSEGGADSCELAGAGHKCYDSIPRPNPLDDAAAFLSAHEGQTSPITVTIGGNDLLALLPSNLDDLPSRVALLPKVYTTYRSNLDTILGRLRTAAGPQTEIIVTTQPNPIGGLGSPPLPPGVGEIAANAVRALNAVVKDEAPKYGAVVADSAAAFDAHAGGAGSLSNAPATFEAGGLANTNIHPTPQGYEVYAAAVESASGFAVPMAATPVPYLSARVVSRGLHPNWNVRVTGRSYGMNRLVLLVRLQGGRSLSRSLIPIRDGPFHFNFKAGSSNGPGSAKVCGVTSQGQAQCTGTMKFKVTQPKEKTAAWNG